MADKLVERLRSHGTSLYRPEHPTGLLLWEAAARITALKEALEPFAACMEYIADDEDDEEWAKFRLLVKDYRRARAALQGESDGATSVAPSATSPIQP